MGTLLFPKKGKFLTHIGQHSVHADRTDSTLGSVPWEVCSGPIN